jgi:hypothetical protein
LSNQQRFRKLLKESDRRISHPKTDLVNAVVRNFPSRLREVETPTQALELLEDAQALPGTSTKSHLFTQHGLRVNGPLFPDAAKSSLVTAYHLDRPCVVKLLSPRADPASEAQAGGPEGVANHDLCHGMPSDVPLVPSKLVLMDLGEGHSDLRRSPGTYAALVMPKYVDTLASALRMSNEALLRGMKRMVKALDWIHDRDYVHMDFKVSLGLMCLLGPSVSLLLVLAPLPLYSFCRILKLACALSK